MSKLNIDQQTIKELFSNKRADFLIPDYQRPYAWEEPECQTLWDDIFVFAFPENDYTKFDSDNDEYFLGPIVTFKNDEGKLEIIKEIRKENNGEVCFEIVSIFERDNLPAIYFEKRFLSIVNYLDAVIDIDMYLN